ncbi:MAG: hypothetical protein PCFJNLEI_00134 [Verrucomicrobiae bacterium]|nr:hypothetical protein [Verrucomicrobiae bacterium]
MDSRKTIFLLVLVALVGGFVVWDHYKGVPTTDRLAKSKRVLAIDAKAVTRVELVRSNQTIVLEKSAENWDIKQPLAVRADFGAVSALLDELEFAERLRTLSDTDLIDANLAEFGLSPPQLTVKLQSKSGPTVLQLGSETPARDARYVSVAGQRHVYVVRNNTFDRVHQSLDQLRSRSAIEFSPASATRLEIKATDRSIELTKSNLWVLTRPLAVRADQTKISALLTDLQNLRIQDFVSEKPEDIHTYHLDEPDREVTVASDSTGKTLLIGMPLTNDATRVYAKLKDRDTIFTIAAESAKRFAVQINDLRDPHLLSFQPADVKAITIARGATTISLQHTATGWKITGPVTGAGDTPAVEQFLAGLAGLRVKEFTADVTTDLEKFGLATPVMTVTLTGGGVLQVGAVDNAQAVAYVKRADEPFIYGVAPEALELIPTSYGAFRSRTIFQYKPEEITRLTVGAVTLERDDQGRWKLVAPAQGVLDADAANAIAGLVAGLRAEAFGRPKTDADNANLVIQFKAGSATHWLANAADGQSAADNTELTFRLAEPVIATLTKKLVHEAKP